MEKKIFNLSDSLFAHDNYSAAGVNSKFISWDRDFTNLVRPSFFSHEKMFKPNLIHKDLSYGLIFESQSIIPLIYQNISHVIKDFNKVFTHSSELLNNFDNCHWIPGGGIWIGGNYGKGEIKIYEKSKICSMVSSLKNMCQLHSFRLGLLDLVRVNNVDVYGIKNHIPIIGSLKDYMFSIVVENYQDDLYFTEKLLNCFATGTIPIYLGAKNIGQKFDREGIITFNSKEELEKILPTLTKELYESKLEAVKNNFEKCLEYRCIEDYIYENHFKN